ncbi:ferredoxin [Sulfurovum sp. bin170]|uniref:4Fe-4S dicluster domain-containing protein n=1 Tax=Sulfurovum sp. bin170 TaxID=2695268 RepID=UPI0013E09824|nr:4Fe-4S dicluster domain-containing protein [Sulfurovum sp. bin170]NEW60777.1 ferredoxin [Sulfurovum sp. bin170]
MRIEFGVASCVRATSKFSQCTKCVDICPVSTIEIVDNIPAFTPSACIDCGGCVGVCPTEAFSLKDFSSVNFFFEFLESKEKLLACKTEIPCLSILSVEHLISLALASDENLVMNVDGCSCGGESDRLTNQIKANIEEANFLLESFSDKRILTDVFESKATQKETVSDRRSLFSLKGALKNKQSFDEVVDADELKAFELDSEVISKIKNKNIPDKRKLLFSVLKRVERPKSYEILASEDISFTSQKFVDETCTNCQICYRICPTGALSSDAKFSVINFDSMMCVKCHLCHDVCEPNSIGIQAGFEIKEFFEPTQRTLASFNIKRCNECGNHFTYTGGLVECIRCKSEESEAMELHTNPKFF